MDSEPLVRAIIAALMVFENASDSEIDPDVAVRGMESITGEISGLEEGDRAELLRIISRIGSSEGDSSIKNFVEGLPFMIGLDSGA
ncbi:hypothetical protein ACQEVI_27190 [Promicromonospora sp. CA-289599]|uniref:hypothetical protein n=1 Tax=Promicromonospora sp. CA-289599 TaxID=3240014 RepID=UPI003D8E8D6D